MTITKQNLYTTKTPESNQTWSRCHTPKGAGQTEPPAVPVQLSGDIDGSSKQLMSNTTMTTALLAKPEARNPYAILYNCQLINSFRKTWRYYRHRQVSCNIKSQPMQRGPSKPTARLAETKTDRTTRGHACAARHNSQHRPRACTQDCCYRQSKRTLAQINSATFIGISSICVL